MTSIVLFFVFVLGFLTMFFGAISGGVGLVTRPILIFMGFPSGAVISSSRVAGVIADWPSLFVLHKNKKVDWRIVAFLVVPMIIGTVLASLAVVTLLKSRLDTILGLLLFFAGLFLLLKPKIGLIMKPRKKHDLKTKILSFSCTLPISFLNTITGGLGPMYSLIYIWIYGKTFISASALWRTASNISTVFSALIFIAAGFVDWQLCISLMLGLGIGGFFGTKFGLRRGENWVKYVIVAVLFAGSIKLLFF